MCFQCVLSCSACVSMLTSTSKRCQCRAWSPAVLQIIEATRLKCRRPRTCSPCISVGLTRAQYPCSVGHDVCLGWFMLHVSTGCKETKKMWTTEIHIGFDTQSIECDIRLKTTTLPRALQHSFDHNARPTHLKTALCL